MKITPVFFLVALVLNGLAAEAKAIDENTSKEAPIRVSPIERHPGLTQKHPGAVYQRSSAKRKAELLAQQKKDSLPETDLVKTPSEPQTEGDLGRARLGAPAEE